MNNGHCIYGHPTCSAHPQYSNFNHLTTSFGLLNPLSGTIYPIYSIKPEPAKIEKNIKGVVVITGAVGFICGHLTKFFLKENWVVYAIDKMSNVSSLDHYDDLLYNDEYAEYRNNLIFIREDICNLKELPDCDLIINGAASTHVDNSITNPDAFIHDNVLGVQNLLNLINKKDNHISSKPLLFHISTDEVTAEIENATEESPLNASSAYSASKASAELLIKAHARTHGLNYIIVRPTNTIGQNQYPEKFIPISCKLWSWGKTIRLHNEGTPLRNWLCVQDLCDAIYYIYNYHKTDTKVQEIYNIAGNLTQSNLVTATKLLKCLGVEDKDIEKHFDLSYTRPGQDMFYSISDAKLKSIGWTHKHHFDKELPNIIKFYLDPEHNRLFL